MTYASGNSVEVIKNYYLDLLTLSAAEAWFAETRSVVHHHEPEPNQKKQQRELKGQVGTRWLCNIFRGDPNAGVVFVPGLNAFGEFATQLLVFEFGVRRHGNPEGSQAFARFIGIGRKNGRPQLSPAL